MKKLIITMFIILLMAGTVMAASSKATVSVTVNEPEKKQEEAKNASQEGELIQVREKVTGLENAQIRVKSEETKQKLLQVMEKIQEKKK